MVAARTIWNTALRIGWLPGAESRILHRNLGGKRYDYEPRQPLSEQRPGVGRGVTHGYIQCTTTGGWHGEMGNRFETGTTGVAMFSSISKTCPPKAVGMAPDSPHCNVDRHIGCAIANPWRPDP